MLQIKDILGFSRAPFLLLPPACVVLGYAAARHDGFTVNTTFLILALIGAIAAHVSVNVFNEYADFRSGLDAKTTRTPFSGGSGTLQRKPELAGWALGVAIGTAVVVAAIGVYFAIVRAWGILPLGVAGLLIIVTYSFWVVRKPILCLVAPGFGFGTCMVIGTYFVLTGVYSWTAVLVSMVPFFLVNNLLLLNQFPDIEADITVGRKNLLIQAGTFTGAVIYASFIASTYVMIVIGVVAGLIPALSLIALITAPLGVMAIISAFKDGRNIPRLVPSMGINVVVNLLTPVLLSAGMLLG